MELDEKKSELKDLQFKYRKSCRESLGEYVGSDSKIPVHAAAVFLKKTPKTIYSWLGQRMFLPELEDCKEIDKLCTTIDRVRESWKTVFISHGRQGHIHSAVKKVFYGPAYLKIIEDEKLSIDKKIDLLTKKTFLAWAKDLEKK